MPLSQFTENMETECNMIGSPVIEISAIKVDGCGDSSLKHILCCNSLKSCDYIKFTLNEICFIEFSDFYEQLINLIDQNEDLLNSNISTDNIENLIKKKIVIKPKNVIKNELQNKISETILLFDLICNNYSISEHKNKNKEFIICICKIIASHSILFDSILREIKTKFQYNVSVDMFIYTDLESYISTRV